jgi:hypothetical protein
MVPVCFCLLGGGCDIWARGESSVLSAVFRMNSACVLVVAVVSVLVVVVSLCSCGRIVVDCRRRR